MIQAANDAVRTLIERKALNGAEVGVVFDTPSDEWVGRRNSPTVDVFLFDIREDPSRHSAGRVDIRDEKGRVVSRVREPRWFNLSYMITAWAQRTEDEHRILSSLLQCLARYDAIPDEFLGESLAGVSVRIGLAQPRSDGQSLSDVWSTLGRQWKAALELVVTVPVDLEAEIAAPVVTQPTEARVSLLDAPRTGK